MTKVKSQPGTLYLIDGYAQFFRAYHAIRTPMTSPVTGEPTHMTFGFVGMLLKLLRGDQPNQIALGGQPTHIAVCLDVSGDRGTFRSQLYPEYKATRSAPPDDLKPQVDRCLKILEAIGIPAIGAAGFEADDVTAPICEMLKDNTDTRIALISKDKDLKQLLESGNSDDTTGRVQMYDVHTDLRTTAESFTQDTGLTTDQVIDMLALMGDTADNVPGVPGIGPKTAYKLLQDFGTLDAVVEEARKPKSTIKGKRQQNIVEAADALPLSKELVTLRKDVPIDFTLDTASTSHLDLEPLIAICRELGFGRYQDEIKALLGRTAEPDAPAKPTKKSAANDAPPADSLFAAMAPAAPREVDGDYSIVRTTAELDAVVAQVSAPGAVVAVDTETTSLSPREANLCGLCISTQPGTAHYIPTRSPEPDTHLDEHTVLEAFRPMLEDPAIPKVGHNLKYDLLVLRNAGVELRGLAHPQSLDTMVASYLIDPSRSSHRLDALALAYLERTNISTTDLIGTGKKQKTFDQVPLEDAGPYAAEDADVTLQLAERMRPELEAANLTSLAADVEMPLVSVLAELEWNGIAVDPAELDRQAERLTARLAELRTAIDDAAMETIDRTFNPDSPKQLSAALFNAPEPTSESDLPGLGIKPIKKTKTGYSTDAEVLEKLAEDPTITSEIPALVLENRTLSKLVGTYLVALKECINKDTGRIHASFNQTVAATGRLSSSDPNLQNIPIRTDVGREIRRAFVAEAGNVLIAADYSQIELRILAHLSEDPALIEAFQRGDDIHAAVAAEVHSVPLEDVTREQRNGAKMINFGIVYGITPFGLARRMGVSNTEASRIIDDYKRRFAGITTFLADCVAQAEQHGFVETMLGRRRPIPDITSNQPNRRALAERMAINSVVQGSAADLIKLAMLDLHRRLSPNAADLREGAAPEIEGVRMLLQIHDELVFEAPKPIAEQAESLITTRMTAAMDLRVPLVADSSISTNWFEGK